MKIDIFLIGIIIIIIYYTYFLVWDRFVKDWTFFKYLYNIYMMGEK